VHLVGFIIRIYHDARSSECQSWTISTRATRQASSLHYLSLIFNFVTLFKKNTEYTSTHMKWAHPRFTQQNKTLLLILATHFQSISCKFTVDYILYFGEDEISYFSSCKERNLRSIVLDCFVMLDRLLFLWPQLILYRGESQLRPVMETYYHTPT
jgi:hypothetical protein